VLTDVRTRSVRGLDLRLRRTRVGVTQTQLAADMGVARPRVSQIEATYRPSVNAVRRYLAALDRLLAIEPADA
jgi:transcriptional regulator with XRE-family HTH domain